jgi:hypothetical protein
MPAVISISVGEFQNNAVTADVASTVLGALDVKLIVLNISKSLFVFQQFQIGASLIITYYTTTHEIHM